MQRKFVPVLVVVALVAAGTAGAMLTQHSPNTDTTAASPALSTDGGSGSQHVSVSGSGSASASPDKAVISVAVVAEGNDTQAIRKELANESSALRTALNYANVAGDQLSTTNYRITENYRPKVPKANTGPAYRGVHSFQIELDGTGGTGGVIDAASDSGAQVTGVQFTLSDETRTDLRDKALQPAMGDARQQADTLATAGNLTITGVSSVDAAGGSYTPVRFDAAAAKTTSSGSTTIETGDVSVSTNVRVVYNASGA
ncbi:MAG: SIMPL domain-containing protein [Halorientalis sp.]